MAKFKTAVACLLIFVLGFFIGMDWPYLLPPDDFGEYTSDGKYKYVITEDETRLCQQVAFWTRTGRWSVIRAGIWGLAGITVFKTSTYIGQMTPMICL